jgi:hypothetical protein
MPSFHFCALGFPQIWLRPPYALSYPASELPGKRGVDLILIIDALDSSRYRDPLIHSPMPFWLTMRS